MSVNYAQKYAKQVDEKFVQASITDKAVNKDYDFVGSQTVKVFSVPTVAMGDYTRSGANRYGTPSELENAVQEMTMSRDRAFTFTVDKGSDVDTDGQMNVGKALNRQISEVIVPEVDAYRLAKMCRGAENVTLGAYTGNGNAGAYECVLDAQAALTVTSAAGSASGKTKITVTGDTDGAGSMGTLVYKTGASQAAPALDDDISYGWTALTVNTDITATNGHKIAVAVKDGNGKAIGGGVTTVIDAT